MKAVFVGLSALGLAATVSVLASNPAAAASKYAGCHRVSIDHPHIEAIWVGCKFLPWWGRNESYNVEGGDGPTESGSGPAEYCGPKHTKSYGRDKSFGGKFGKSFGGKFGKSGKSYGSFGGKSGKSFGSYGKGKSGKSFGSFGGKSGKSGKSYGSFGKGKGPTFSFGFGGKPGKGGKGGFSLAGLFH